MSQAVEAIHYQPLANELLPLANKFYKSQRSNMRVGRSEQVWIARQGQIIAACCLKPIEHGQWLTALLVASQRRQQGIASTLLRQLLHSRAGPVWLFCHPDLLAFYQRQGFQLATKLPAALTDRLRRYQQKQPLLALVWQPPILAVD
ncbi:MAG: GNAT family N-acetyltransferase [Pseudomonas sp.]|uniref:GNAT family N-acetyltransferase n=1 Tax=Pseudomonas sp. TaxID=306 RepID=UPI002735D855|nr:GNAT family N-acetyltransferase [Pseudomonas sp.]MDP3848194.1 GNAT family N-acetyltransferase [Pseudomonas sp.]